MAATLDTSIIGRPPSRAQRKARRHIRSLTGDFPEDSSGMTIAVFRALAAVWPQPLLQWLPPALHALPTATTPDETKTRFLGDVTE